MIILSGANTIAARYLLPVLRDKFQVCSFDQEHGDIKDPNFLEKLFNDVNPTVFINVKEFNDIEEAEFKREEAYQINGFIPGTIAHLCKTKGVYLLHLSSSFIYDSSADVELSENSLIKPNNVFSDSKSLGEKKIAESSCRHCILRVPYIYGKGEGIISDILKSIKNNKEITVIKGQIISTLFIEDIVPFIISLVEKKAEGVYNLSNSGAANIKDFIIFIKRSYEKATGKSYSLNLKEVDFNDFESPVEWPIYNSLNLTKVIEKTSIKPRNWQEALDDYIQKNKDLL